MYLVGMMGQNMIYNIIGTGLYFYFQSVIFIPAMAISIFQWPSVSLWPWRGCGMPLTTR